MAPPAQQSASAGPKAAYLREQGELETAQRSASTGTNAAHPRERGDIEEEEAPAPGPAPGAQKVSGDDHTKKPETRSPASPDPASGDDKKPDLCSPCAGSSGKPCAETVPAAKSDPDTGNAPCSIVAPIAQSTDAGAAGRLSKELPELEDSKFSGTVTPQDYSPDVASETKSRMEDGAAATNEGGEIEIRKEVLAGNAPETRSSGHEAANKRPAMFAYSALPKPPPSLPRKPSTRAPLPSQRESFSAFPSRNFTAHPGRNRHVTFNLPPSDTQSGTEARKDGGGVDRNSLAALVFATTPAPEDKGLLQLPLPSRRQTRRATSSGVLIPVDRLPLTPLPTLPPILDKEIEKVVFSHQGLFPRDAGVFEYAVDQEGKGGVPHYEKLEHVGDAILGGVVTTWLHRCWPGLTCGTATKLKAHLVSNNTLSHLSGQYHLPARLSCASPLLRVQTDVRAALVEAYIAGVYFSRPPDVGWKVVTSWLEELYEPIADWFLAHMRGEHRALLTIGGALPSLPPLPSGTPVPALSALPALSEETAALVAAATTGGGIGSGTRKAEQQAPVNGELALKTLSHHCRDTRTTLEFNEKRLRMSSGTLWRIGAVVGGKEHGAATRVTKDQARGAAAAEACAALGLEMESS